MLDFSCYANRVRRISRLFRDSAGAPEPLALAGTPQVDSGEDHGQLRRRDFDAVASGGVGQLEGAGLEAFVPDGQAVAVEVEDLDPIPAAVDEEEEMAGQEILAEALLNQPGKAIKTFTHVGRSGAREHAHGRGELREHQS